LLYIISIHVLGHNAGFGHSPTAGGEARGLYYSNFMGPGNLIARTGDKPSDLLFQNGHQAGYHNETVSKILNSIITHIEPNPLKMTFHWMYK
jgi:hypothetical protein